MLGIVTVEDIDYAVLIPLDDDQTYIFRIDTDEMVRSSIRVEDDEEFNIVKEAGKLYIGQLAIC